jgi:carbamoyl-phosphate synthase/aspartate carbamoyltransferase
MKSVGEVMAIGRSFEETIQKAIRAVDFASNGFCRNNQITNVIEELKNPSDMRLFAIANALHDGMSIEKIWEYTKIDRWFLSKLENIVKHEKLLQ